MRRKQGFIEKRFNFYTEDDLFNIKLMRKQIRERVPGMTIRSQRGLFHGKRKRNGHMNCFSEKKTLRYFKPNVQLKFLWSNFFQRQFRVHITASALKKIRHYGGIDNYLLLAYSRKMWSSLGEYLRKVMLLKLQRPQLNLEGKQIMGMEKNLFKTKRALKSIKNPIFLPGDMRHRDLTYLKSRKNNDYSRRELKVMKAHLAGEDEYEVFKEEAEEMRRRQNEAFGDEEDPLVVQKLNRWLAKKAKESPKFYKMYMLQTHGKSKHEELYRGQPLDDFFEF